MSPEANECLCTGPDVSVSKLKGQKLDGRAAVSGYILGLKF